MKRFNFWLPLELFERIKLMAEFFERSTSSMTVMLLETGYLEYLKMFTSYEEKCKETMYPKAD